MVAEDRPLWDGHARSMPRPFKRNIENSEIDAAFSPIAVAFINAANVIMPRIFIVPGAIELRSPYKIVVPLIIVSKIVALLIVTSRNRYFVDCYFVDRLNDRCFVANRFFQMILFGFYFVQKTNVPRWNGLHDVQWTRYVRTSINRHRRSPHSINTEEWTYQQAVTYYWFEISTVRRFLSE